MPPPPRSPLFPYTTLFRSSRAVGGIGNYGNCVGVPTIGGETVFDDAYASNCLVNAMCVGLLPVEQVTRARATVSSPTHIADRKSTRLNSSHLGISYAVFCL